MFTTIFISFGAYHLPLPIEFLTVRLTFRPYSVGPLIKSLLLTREIDETSLIPITAVAHLQHTYLILGGTGQTGKHFIAMVLGEGHKVRALVRNPEKIEVQDPNLEVVIGSIIDYQPLDELLRGVNFVVSMLGDVQRQQSENVNTEFVKKLIPAMRRQSVKRFLYQAGGFTRPYQEKLPFTSWLLKQTLVRFSGLLGQHRDNEAVIQYLVEEASDIEWMVHRASLYGDGPSRGILKKSKTKFSIAHFIDCATYNYHLLNDGSAVHTYDLSYYQK